MSRSAREGSERRRLVPRRAAGCGNDAPYWRGERCEYVVAARWLAENEMRAAKLTQRQTTRGATHRRERTPSAELRRLQRALQRRKTLAARVRLQQRIRELSADLGLPDPDYDA